MLKFSKEMYNKNALLKTAYSFTDKAYIHLDVDEQYYLVKITSKSEDICISENDFINEMLAQTVRLVINKKTRNVRELILARALSSTLIEDTIENNDHDEDFDIEDILKDWFEKYE